MTEPMTTEPPVAVDGNGVAAPDDLPVFTQVPVSERPATFVKGDPAQLRLGTALLAAISPTMDARDPQAGKTRKDAVNRANALKRAVKAAGGAPAGYKITTRIDVATDGFHVIAGLTTDTPAADAPKVSGKTAKA